MTSGTEEEQLAQIKEWWQQNGKPLLFGGALALVLVFGWQFWQKHQLNEAHSASTVYQQLLNAALEEGGADTAEVSRLGNLLQKEFAGSHYAQYGSLFVAKVAVESGRLDEAATELQAVLDKPADKTLEELARQRMARVLAAQDKAEDGLALLDGEAVDAFAASREELRGDLLVQLQRPEEAHAAYSKAKELLSQDAAIGGLQLKLDDLARGEA
ncbi:MAG: tetratricopeptide repeat protein [Gammaproteobacteria bacterium]|uniref:YfgM family protein n=1 Tax=Stutzerimonas xanthomarina TaxID=271420 RepID=UPI00190C81E0|nr:tetratricopeptide repeat protein [Stutzerimonas xanthomarina]MBU0854470.1 tetratricopeptide repeat protein [Gammaproteobacteria bacterium]MBK3848175.1 tetratricopeptide repeat protein [Stutzerimonas xanthomarina]MBU1301254.1 tetratricopeptide repeat protein [Gammaproteobacteria bacterium]MBU1459653.1 tetratricopeptide repeat protein [Gammaproteobacteria bacterium]MBU1774041.1 tetratricopeptide repeat protein [Gammaproteobacteria bacterium]